jgi:hypothetical protein
MEAGEKLLSAGEKQFMARAMGIESTPEAWDEGKMFSTHTN